MDTPEIQQDSAAWRVFVQLSFVLAVAAMVIAIWNLPVGIWIRGFLGIGLFYTISATVIVTKTMRDDHEARKLIKQLSTAKAEKLIKDYTA